MGGVILVTGGRDENRTNLDSTEQIKIADKTLTITESLKMARRGHVMATMVVGGQEGLYSIGGRGNDGYLDTVEHYHEDTSTWVLQTERLPEAKYFMSAVLAPMEMICPV